MSNRHTRRRKGKNAIPRWGWIVILSFLALIGGTVLHIKGTIPAIVSSLSQKQSSIPPNSLPHVDQNPPPIHSTLIRAHSLAIIARTNFLANCAESGFIYPHAVDYYLGCITASEEIKNNIRKIPLDNPKISEARSHLVEMALEFERMIQCFEESESDGKRHFRMPSDNKMRFSISANSVIVHYQKLDLVCPE